jgi:hypothetical protein
MRLRKKKITREVIRMLDGWRHSGFNVFAGEPLRDRSRHSSPSNSRPSISSKQRLNEKSPMPCFTAYLSSPSAGTRFTWRSRQRCGFPFCFSYQPAPGGRRLPHMEWVRTKPIFIWSAYP